MTRLFLTAHQSSVLVHHYCLPLRPSHPYFSMSRMGHPNPYRCIT